jgi:hypothetical protein
MKRVKKPKKKQVTMTKKQVNTLKDEVRHDLLDKLSILILLAVHDEIGLSDEQLCSIIRKVNRYAGYIEEHKVRMLDIQNAIEKGTGVKMKGWC